MRDSTLLTFTLTLLKLHGEIDVTWHAPMCYANDKLYIVRLTQHCMLPMCGTSEELREALFHNRKIVTLF